jgi:hypothetical protein
MDFLDPKKQKAHLIRLAIGYILIGTALLLTTIILLYRAYGFGIKNGEVIQNGLIFVSSRPGPASIYVNGKLRSETTNARLLMEAGQYTFELKRDGYRPWKRAINVEGGAVVRFDYPVLFPAKLTTTTAKKYEVRPELATQSPDRRWLLVQGGAAYNAFDLYDLDKNEIAPGTLTLPDGVSTLTEGTHHWKLLEWASDNRHILLQHSTDNAGQTASEFILVDRQTPSESVNFTKTLGMNPTKLVLRDKKYDQYYVYTQQDAKLLTASLDHPQPAAFLDRVLDFKPHGSDVLLYATDQGAENNKAVIKLREGDKTYVIRQVSSGTQYLLELAKYENAWYIVAGAPSEGRIYVYKNPAAVLQADPKAPLVPVQVLKAANATYVSFSDNARFVMAQGGQQFAVYDAETDRGYAYAMANQIDAGEEHAFWMDGHRMMFVSGGKALVFDFDNANREALSAADAAYRPFFDRDYKNLYTLNTETVKMADGQETSQIVLSRTPLLTPQDQ